MAISDSIADMLTKIRNAYRAGHTTVVVRNSKINKEIMKVLQNEGYINKFRVEKRENSVFSFLKIMLRYDDNNKPVIHEIEKISKPGRRVYAKYRNIERVRNGFGTYIVSTSQGVISDREARKNKVGGELICLVW